MPATFMTPQPVWPLTDRGLTQRLIDLAMLPFVTGEQPFARQAFFEDLEAIEPLVPKGAVTDWELDQDGGDYQRSMRGEGWRAHMVLVRRRPEVQVLVTANSAALADEILDAMRAAAPVAERSAEFARLTMWTGGTTGSPGRYRRWVDTPHWQAIAANYADDVRAPLGRLMAMDEPPAQGGRLLLWYGDPGTGKTTAIRSMAREWARWADVHFILDPEEFFGSPDYLMHVVAAEDEWWERNRSKNRRWKVIVVEDADELIRADAGRTAGASLGRLLNLTDGILGHGMRVLLLITTNEPVRALHPAVVRPGRCLADVRFRPFTHHEASEWLQGQDTMPEGQLPAGDATLAELYRIRGGLERFANDRPHLTGGMYL
jgi:Domain of unknown function (DUF5925)/ATPase family associated with various cellular activities (AAA)